MKHEQALKAVESTPGYSSHFLVRAANVSDANDIAETMIGQLSKTIDNSQILRIQPEKGSIGIENVRSLKPITSKKSVGDWQIIVIKDANKLTIEAQNYLLKELEDSSVGKLYILASDLSHSIMSTIVSRMQIVNYMPPDLEEFAEANKILFKASGYSVTNLKQLRANNSQSLQEAKLWLSSPAEQRLSQLAKINASSEDSLNFLKVLKVVLFGMQINYTLSENKKALKKTIDKLKHLQFVEQRIENRGNIKLNLTQLALTL